MSVPHSTVTRDHARALRESGMLIWEIAARTGVPRPTVAAWCKGIGPEKPAGDFCGFPLRTPEAFAYRWARHPKRVAVFRVPTGVFGVNPDKPEFDYINERTDAEWLATAAPDTPLEWLEDQLEVERRVA